MLLQKQNMSSISDRCGCFLNEKVPQTALRSDEEVCRLVRVINDAFFRSERRRYPGEVASSGRPEFPLCGLAGTDRRGRRAGGLVFHLRLVVLFVKLPEIEIYDAKYCRS